MSALEERGITGMILLLALALCQDRLEKHEVGGTPKVHRLGKVCAAGQPKPEDFALFKKDGIRVVLDLRRDAETPGFDEKAAVEAAGLEYVNLPVGGLDDLTDAAFDRARALLNDREKPVLIHCAAASRVGPFWLVWRALDGKLPIEEAVAEARTVGLRSAAMEARAREYVARKTKR